MVLHILCPLLVVLGLSLDLDDRNGNLWGVIAAWAAFATLASLAQGAALLANGDRKHVGWTVAAAGAAGLLLFWTLLILPVISTNAAFLITLGVVAGVAAVALNPARKG